MKNLTTQQAELHAHRRLEEGSGPIGAWPYAAWRGDEGDFDGFCVRLVLTDGATTVAPENPAFLRRVSDPATVPPELVAHIVERYGARFPNAHALECVVQDLANAPGALNTSLEEVWLTGSAL